MPNKNKALPKDYTHPLYLNKLQGRMLYVPPRYIGSREFLVVYDRLNSIEEWWEFTRLLNRFGAVTKTDLPGFGGMQSFYRIKEKPSIDRLADYLSAFIKLRYRRKQLTIVGIGFGFVIITRMLQKYPDVAKKVTLVISIDGYSHKDDFRLGLPKKIVFRFGGWLGSQRLPAMPLQLMGLRKFIIRCYFIYTPRNRLVIANFKPSAKEKFVDQKINNLQKTNLRTQLSLLSETMKLDNCQKQLNIPLWHVAIKSNTRLNHAVVEQHLRIIYKPYHQATLNVSVSRLAELDNKAAAQLLPTKLRRALARH